MMNLDAANLEAILQEARDCFLYEDAPGYMAELEQGIQMLHTGVTVAQLAQYYPTLMRSAHSIKGGAGIAELPVISRLAHKLEDGFQCLMEDRLQLDDPLKELIEATTAQLKDLLVIGASQGGGFDAEEHETTDALIATWVEVLATLPPAREELLTPEYFQENTSLSPELLKVALESDLEECLQRLEQITTTQPTSPQLRVALAEFCEEGLLLGQALRQDWLIAIVNGIQDMLGDENAPLMNLAGAVLVEIRTMRAEVLGLPQPDATVPFMISPPVEAQEDVLGSLLDALDSEAEPSIGLDLTDLYPTVEGRQFPETDGMEHVDPSLSSFELDFGAIAEDSTTLEPNSGEISDLSKSLDLSLPEVEGAASSELSNAPSDIGEILSLIDSLPNTPPTVEPGLEALQANAVSLNPEQAAQRLAASGDLSQHAKVTETKESKATANPVPTFLNLRIPVSRLDRMSNLIGELLISYERLSLQQNQLQQTSRALKVQTQQLNPINDEVRVFYDQLATAGIGGAASGYGGNGHNSEFDLLAFDQYTSLHSTLQSFQELMVQVQESRTDLDLINRDFQESLAQLRQQLGGLYQDLTSSRLVPFQGLASRFITPLQGFCKRFNKIVDLNIVGQETMVDQVLVDQLQTPLTHLIRNAFDHGIEPLEDRLVSGKNPTAQITLSADVQANEVVIQVSDDGRGVNLDKVYERAQRMKLTTLDRDDLTDAQILEFLFAPGFSTAKAVTELSGRGVGLDAVRSQISQLRGSVQVRTIPDEGTTFTITLPMSLNILPLLLCRCQQRTLAIPSPNIREIVALAEYLPEGAPETTIRWQDQTIPVFSLIDWLPYRQGANSSSGSIRSKLGVILDVQGQPVAVAIDALLGERELVLKPFDLTVPVPAYIAGCTVLGTGEVVPVLAPKHLLTLLQTSATDRWGTAGQELERSVAPSLEDSNTILIADDSVAVRRFLDKLLTSAGYRVVACRDGKEALDALEQNSKTFRLLISDIEMPRLDGLGLLRSLRADDRFSALPVAILTSRDNAQHRQKAEDLGANAYFTKPFQPRELLEGVERLCSSRVAVTR